MSQSIFSLDHHLAEIRQVGDDLRSARLMQANRPSARTSIGDSIRTFFAGLPAASKPARLATR